MTATTAENDQLRSLLADLVDRCPFDHANPNGCPLHDLRSLSRAERLAFIEGLSDATLEDLVVYHWVCYENRILALTDPGEGVA